jgi:hypothetical protein
VKMFRASARTDAGCVSYARSVSDEIDQILEAFLQESLPKIERLVTRALRDGRAVSELAIDFERGLDEQVRGGCAPRAAIERRWRTHPDLDDAKRAELADLIAETAPSDIPVAMTIPIRGFKIYGVKRIEGDIIAPEKPN